jgi:hypothetical protein
MKVRHTLMLVACTGGAFWFIVDRGGDEVGEVAVVAAAVPIPVELLRERLAAASAAVLEEEKEGCYTMRRATLAREDRKAAIHGNHAQRLRRVEGLAQRFSELSGQGDNCVRLRYLFGLLEKEGVAEAVDFFESIHEVVLDEMAKQPRRPRRETEVLLVGAQLAIANGEHRLGHKVLLRLLDPKINYWPEACFEYVNYLMGVEVSTWKDSVYGPHGFRIYERAERELRLLVHHCPQNVEYAKAYADCMEGMGDGEFLSGERGGTLGRFRNANQRREALMKKFPELRSELERDEMRTREKIAHLSIFTEEDDEMAQDLGCHPMLRKLAELDVGNDQRYVDLWRGCLRDAQLEAARDYGRVSPEVEMLYVEACELAEEVSRKLVRDTDWARRRLISYQMMGDISAREEKWEVARVWYQIARDYLESDLLGKFEKGEEYRYRYGVYYMLALTYFRSRDHENEAIFMQKCHGVLLEMKKVGERLYPDEWLILEGGRASWGRWNWVW